MELIGKLEHPIPVVLITVKFWGFLWIFAICSLSTQWTLLRSMSKSLFVHRKVLYVLSIVYVLYLNIAYYLYGKQINSKLGNKLYLLMIFICVQLNQRDLHECHTITLKVSLFILYEFCPGCIPLYNGLFSSQVHLCWCRGFCNGTESDILFSLSDIQLLEHVSKYST